MDLYNIDKNTAEKLVALPGDLGDALKLTEQSDFVRNTLPGEILSKFLQLKTAEYQDYCEAVDKREHFITNYFKIV